tara:strand:- start:21497 stop:23638 length:2142 start_codon:yes stop_codon:yes gene_type:complete
MYTNGLFNFLIDKKTNSSRDYLLYKRPENSLDTFFDNPESSHLRIDKNYYDSDIHDPNGRKYAHLSPAHYTERCLRDGEEHILHVYFGSSHEKLKVTLQKRRGELLCSEEVDFVRTQRIDVSIEWAIQKLGSLIEERDQFLKEQQKEILALERAIYEREEQINRADIINKLIDLGVQCDRYSYGQECGATRYYTQLAKNLKNKQSNKALNRYSVFARDLGDELDEDTSEDLPLVTELAQLDIKVPEPNEIQLLIAAYDNADNVIEQHEAYIDILAYTCDSPSAKTKDINRLNSILNNYKSPEDCFWDFLLSADLKNLRAMSDYYGSQMQFRTFLKFLDIGKQLVPVSHNDKNFSKSLDFIIKEIGIWSNLLPNICGLANNVPYTLKQTFINNENYHSFKVLQKYYPRCGNAVPGGTTTVICWVMNWAIKKNDNSLIEHYINTGGQLRFQQDDSDYIVFDPESSMSKEESKISSYSHLGERMPRAENLLVDLVSSQHRLGKGSSAIIKMCTDKMNLVDLLLSAGEIVNDPKINTVTILSGSCQIGFAPTRDQAYGSIGQMFGAGEGSAEQRLLSNIFYVGDVSEEQREIKSNNIILILNTILSHNDDIRQAIKTMQENTALYCKSLHPFALYKAFLIAITKCATQETFDADNYEYLAKTTLMAMFNVSREIKEHDRDKYPDFKYMEESKKSILEELKKFTGKKNKNSSITLKNY